MPSSRGEQKASSTKQPHGFSKILPGPFIAIESTTAPREKLCDAEVETGSLDGWKEPPDALATNDPPNCNYTGLSDVIEGKYYRTEVVIVPEDECRHNPMTVELEVELARN